MRPIQLVFDFPARYEVQQIERIDRAFSRRVLGYPGAVPADPQQELAQGPILAVSPAGAAPWIGVFASGWYNVPPAAATRVIGWPDEKSLCVVDAGTAYLVRTDDPDRTITIDAFPITGVFVAARHGLVVFADFSSLIAYDHAGIAWTHPNIALDEVAILGSRGDTLNVAGFFGDDRAEFTVELRTGQTSGRPWDASSPD